jgi:RNA polymerase sigma-70 factor (ECF subfamily)
MRDSPPGVVPLRSLPTGNTVEQGDDDQLMMLAAGGAKPAFGVLVARYMARVTKYCLRFVGQASAAEELAQEIFLELWARRARYRSQGKFVVFLFTLARHRCLNRLRQDSRQQRREQAELDGQASASGACAADQLDVLLEQERQRRLRSALLVLSPKLREAVLLRFDQGLDYPDVARILGCSESTTRSRIRLAMQRLREELRGGKSP